MGTPGRHRRHGERHGDEREGGGGQRERERERSNELVRHSHRHRLAPQPQRQAQGGQRPGAQPPPPQRLRYCG